MRITKLQLNALWATTYLFVLALTTMGAFVLLALKGVSSDIILAGLGAKTGAYGGGIVYIARTFAGAPENGEGADNGKG